jgi:hypothetical protein
MLAFNSGSLILLIASRSNSSCSSCLEITFIDLPAQQLSVQPNLISGVEDDEDKYSSEEDSISSGDISFSLSVFFNSRRLYNSSFSLSFI